MFLIILHTPGYTSDLPKWFFEEFDHDMNPKWNTKKVSVLSFAEAKQAVRDLLSHYKDYEPDFECSLGTYEIVSMEMIASTSWGK